jgi:ArsR family transcriptional regulator, arsenate/arsenite/antimonite-responsive transcriptional repressor
MTALLELNAERFKAMGHPVRLSILRLVVQGHETGTPAGEIQERLGIPASTLSHHLACLAETGLVQVEREGTFLRYRAHYPNLKALSGFLLQDCCSGGRIEAGPTPERCCGVKVRKPKA